MVVGNGVVLQSLIPWLCGGRQWSGVTEFDTLVVVVGNGVVLQSLIPWLCGGRQWSGVTELQE